MPPKKSLRRKPPPDVDDLYTKQPAVPLLPPTLYSKPNNDRCGPIDQKYTHRLGYPTVDTSVSFNAGDDDSFDELIIWDSPKPMGPKELPEFLDDSEVDSSQRYLSSHQRHHERPQLPYPIEDIRLTESFDEPIDPYSRTSQIIADSLNTPSKIPRLHASDSLQRPTYDYSVESTPTTSSGMLAPQNILTPQSSSRNLGGSPTTRYDRSPSPNQVYARSPSLLYKYEETTPGSDGTDLNLWEDYEVEGGEELTLHDRTSAWSSVETDGLGSSLIQDYYYDDEFDDLYDDPDTPATNYFDYSILPDLPTPSLSPTSSHLRKLPTRRTLAKKDSQFSISRKRLEEDLPPVPLDLPRLPFSSSSLVAHHLSQCSSVWSLSSVHECCLKLETWLHDEFISKKEFKKALIKLIVFHRRNISLDVVGRNVDQIITDFISSGAVTLVAKDGSSGPNEMGVVMQRGVAVGGVLTQLTDCYCRDRDHTIDPRSNKDISSAPKLRCYSSKCHLNNIIAQETLMRNTKLEDVVLELDWASHWKLTADDLRSLDKSTAKRQSLIFDLLRYEQTFILRGLCFVEIVAPEFLKATRVLLGANRSIVDKFHEEVIAPGWEVVRIHKEVLFQPLLRILVAEGRFIKSIDEISAIYNEWAIAVKKSLLQYMSALPMIEDLMRYEPIKRWVDVEVRKLPRVQDLQVNGPLLFISTFNSRYQQLPLQLSDIKLLYDEQDSEFIALTQAIESVKLLGAKINDMKIHADNIHALKRLKVDLLWRKDVKQVNINLSSENRRLIRRGDIQRRGELKFSTSTSHLILLDNYLFVTERSNLKAGIKYKISDSPIPIELLLFETKEKDIDKSRRNSPVQNTLQGTSPTNEAEEDASTYAFKVRFAGRKYSTFTFIARSEAERMLWINSFTEAKSNLCRRLSQSAPFELIPVDISSFSYDSAKKVTKLQVCAPADPLYDMSQKSLSLILGQGQEVGFGVSGQIQCYTSFQLGKSSFKLAGLSTGLYYADNGNRWKRIIYEDVTAISCIPELRIVILMANKMLKYYTMDLILSVYYELSNKLPCIQLSNDTVQFFEVGKHRGMIMVFYAKKKTSSSSSTNFKAVIPEIDNDGVFTGFKVFKRFYVQAECFGLSIFNTSLAVHTNKGFEVLELDKLHPRSVPDIPGTDARKIDGYSRRLTSSALSIGSNGTNHSMEVIRKHVTSSSAKPMGMFKLNNNSEFLLVYNDGAVFTNKHGKISRPGMLHFDFKAQSVMFFDNNLFLITSEVVEVWSISDFVLGSNRLIQVVTGKDVRLVGKDPYCVCAVANPLVPGMQLMFELEPKETFIG